MDILNELYKYNLSLLDRINETSSLLERYYNIKFLTYRRFTDDGKLLHISRSFEWLECSLENKFLTSNSSVNRIVVAQEGKLTPFLWPSKARDRTYKALFDNGFCNGITVYEKYNNQVELWAFYTGKEQEDAQQLFINNFDIISRFIVFFKEKHYDIINNKNENILINTPISKYLGSSAEEKKRALFMQETKLNKVILKDNKNNNVSITMQEGRCLFELCRGKSIKQIAKDVEISPRTVEFYLNNAKTKLNCATTNQLIMLANNSILEDYLK